jgi:hypothetical protein
LPISAALSLVGHLGFRDLRRFADTFGGRSVRLNVIVGLDFALVLDSYLGRVPRRRKGCPGVVVAAAQAYNQSREPKLPVQLIAQGVFRSCGLSAAAF